MSLPIKSIAFSLAFALMLPSTGVIASLVSPSYAFASTSASSSSKGSSLSLSAAKAKKGLVKVGSYYYYYKNGKKIKSKWLTIKGKRYYFKTTGRAATGSYKVKSVYYIFNAKGVLQKSTKTKVVKVGKSRYLTGPKGKAVSGWQIISGKLYYASKTGKCAASKTVDMIPFNASGYAKPANNRTKLMIKARTIVAKITNSKMTRLQKLNACWDYTISLKFRGDLFPANGYDPVAMVSTPKRLKSGWTIDLAYQTITNGIGNCWGWSCTFSALAKALGEDPYIIFDSGTHTSVRIANKHWDNVGNIRNGSAPYWPTKDEYTTKFW